MEQSKFTEKLEAIKKEHKYETYRPYSGDTMARGENLADALPKIIALRKEIDEYKQQLMKQRSELYDEISAFLSSKGLNGWEYTGKSMKKTTAKHLDAINIKLSEKYRYNDYSIANEMSMMEKYIKLTLEKRAQSERETAAKETAARAFAALLETAKDWMTAEELQTATSLGATPEQIENLIKDRYEKSKIGESISISCCSECDTYIMGDRRCSCGNRRISAYAEGYFWNGKYQLHIQTEAY